MPFLIVRHGEIQSNIKKIYAGRSGEKLTQSGTIQAKKVAEVLSHYNVHSIRSSPIRRAVETAEIIGEIIGKKPIIDDCLTEIELGCWEGLSEEEVKNNYPIEWEVWNNRPAELIFDNRETLDELLTRILDGLVKIPYVEESVVLVTHVAIIRVLKLFASNLDLNLYRQVPVPANCSIFEFDKQLLNDLR